MAASTHRPVSVTAAKALAGPALLAEQVVRAMPLAVLVLSREGRLLLANPPAEQLLHLSAAEQEGQLLKSWRAPGLPAALHEALQEAVRADRPVTATFFLPHNRCWVEMTTQPTPTQVMVYWQDITRLLQAQDHYRTLAENSPEAISRWGPDLRMQYANPALEAQLALPAAQMLGRTVLELGIPADVEHPFTAKMWLAFTTGQTQEHQNALLAARGEQYYQTLLVPEIYEDRVQSVLVLAQNVTAFKQVEDELRTSKELLETIFDASPSAINLLQAVRNEEGLIADFKVVLANAQAMAIAGRPIVGLLMTTVWPHTLEMGLFDKMAQVVETGRPLDMEAHFDADGLDRWLRWTAVRLGDGVVMNVEDITARKLAETALRDSKELLETIFRATLEGIEVLRCVRDASGNLIDFEWVMSNESAYREPERRKVIGHTLLATDPEVLTNGAFAYFCQAAQEKVRRQFEVCYPQPNGAESWFQVAAAPFGDGLLLTWQEITARKQATAELLRLQLGQQQQLANAVLEAQEIERRRISEGLHNGLGQLLFAAKLQLDQLAGLPAAPPDFAAGHHRTQQLLANAISQARTLSHELIPTILEDYGLATAVREICLNASSPTRNLVCVADELPPLPPQLALALYRMAQELVQNITKHAQASRAILSLFLRDGWLVLEADDNGQGFEPEAGSRAGIGLKTIRDRLKLLDGQVHLRTTPGQGTQVSIWVPAAALGETERPGPTGGN